MKNQQDIINSVLAGDTDAFRRIIEENERLVAHVVFRMIPHEADRQDMCQDIFVKVFQNLKKFKFKSKLSTWIAQISYNHCLNYLEKKKIPLLEDIASDNMTNGWPAQENSPETDAVNHDISTLLKESIASLPAHFRTIVTLYHLDDMSYNEISEVMSIPVGTIKSYLFRARKLLKERLVHTYGQEALC